MNKNDIKLIIIILLIGIVFLLLSKNDNSLKKAVVYYEDNIILEVKLDKKKEYTVKGYLDEVVIETDINKIRVKKETSPFHLCSKQGFVNNSNIPIVCLPNKIVIKIEDDDELDAVIG